MSTATGPRRHRLQIQRALETLRIARPELHLGPDGKTLLAVRGRTLVGVSISIQHARGADWIALTPETRATEEANWLVNGTGAFEVGGPIGDNGLSGKKLVPEGYDPAIPIGAGATFGKDPRKVNPRGQALAHDLALKEVTERGAKEATVWLAYRPRRPHPTLVRSRCRSRRCLGDHQEPATSTTSAHPHRRPFSSGVDL